MKVDIVELVENEMVELDVAQIGSNWGYSGVESEDDGEFGSGECGDGCGDGHAKKTNLAGYLPTTKLPSPHPLPNQSKPTV